MNNKQAFPANGQFDGMTLRQFYAAMTMMGMSANPSFNGMEVDQIAKVSLAQADALINYEQQEDSDE